MTYLAKLFGDNAARIAETGIRILGEDVVVGGAIADALGLDAGGAPVLVFRLPEEASAQGAVFVAALAAAKRLDGHPELVRAFARRGGPDAKAKGATRLILLGDELPGGLLSALAGVATSVKVVRQSIVHDLHAPVRFDLVYDSSRPDPFLVVLDDKVGPQHESQEVVVSPLLAGIRDRIAAFGNDVTISVKSTHTGFYRSFNFAVAHDLGGEVELGFRLPSDADRPARLRDGSDWGWASVDVFAPVRDPADLDDELLAWLRAAYERA